MRGHAEPARLALADQRRGLVQRDAGDLLPGAVRMALAEAAARMLAERRSIAANQLSTPSRNVL